MLHPKQQEAVCHVTGPCLCLAGPGSGKTTVLTRRIAHLILVEGVEPERILVLTYSKAAAMEMRERFETLAGTALPVVFGTFHSVFLGILRKEYGPDAFRLMNRKEKLRLLAETVQASGLEDSEEKTLLQLEREWSYRTNTMTKWDEDTDLIFSRETMERLYRDYEARKQACGLWDFDDLLTKTRELFANHPAALQRWQRRFSFLLIDETQDINALQFEIVRLLALPENNLFLVGDDDQSIYGFRGATPEVLLRFESLYPEGKKIVLGENYRCAVPIVEASRRLIGHNQERFPKKLSAKKAEGWICEREMADEEEEEKGVADLLETWGNEIGYDGLAVLYRNHRQALGLAELCRKRGIPLHIRDMSGNPYTHWVILDVIAYLRLATGCLQRRELLRVMNRPDRGISRASVEKEQIAFPSWRTFYENQPKVAEAIEKLERDLRFLSGLSGKAALLYIRRQIGYERYVRQEAQDQEGWQQAFTLLELLAEDAVNSRQFLEVWEEAAAFWEAQNEKRNCAEREKGVAFLTLHGSKGLEFERVVILDCNEGVLPSDKAVTQAQVEEERRLFYVGLTRAKEGLCLCHCRYRRGEKKSPSRFLKEMQGDQEKTHQSSISLKAASSNSSSNRSSTASYSASLKMFSRVGVPSSASL